MAGFPNVKRSVRTVQSARPAEAEGQPSQEPKAVKRAVPKGAAAQFELGAVEQARSLEKLIGSAAARGQPLKGEGFQALAEPLRLLALEIDNLWGDANGAITVQEFDRACGLYLAAMPMFYEEADHLLELASYLGFDTRPAASLRAELAATDLAERAETRPFRDLFDQALAQADVPGAPELLRDAIGHERKWHRLSILEHSAFAVKAARELCQATGLDWKEAAGTLLLHDVGKILERQVDEKHVGEFNFWNHDKAGADWLEQRGVPAELAFLVRHHVALRNLSEAELVQLAAGDKRLLSQLVVIYVADQLAKGDTPAQLESFRGQEGKIRSLAQRAGLDVSALFSRVELIRREVVAQADLADQIRSGAP